MSLDKPPSSPQKPGQSNDDQGVPPKYPSDAQKARLKNIAAREKADKADKNPEAILSELDAAKETPQQRDQRLGEFISKNEKLAAICPTESLTIGIKACCSFENTCRKLFDEPDLTLGEEDAGDEELQGKIKDAIQQKNNDTRITKLKSETKAKEETVKTGDEAVQKSNEDIVLGNKANNEERRKTNEVKRATEKRDDNSGKLDSKTEKTESATAELSRLQNKFDEIKSTQGTIAALRTIRAEAKAPKTKSKISTVLNTATALISAVNNPAFERILNHSQINLAASSPMIAFAGVLAASDKSNKLTEEDKKTIRRIIGQSEDDFQTGTDAKKIAHSKEQVIDPDTGEVISEKYVHDSPENMAKIREYMGTYMDGERMILASTNGSFPPRDVTGYGPDDLGLLAEALEFHSAAEQYGATGFVESIGNLHYDVLGSGAFNRKKLIETRQVIGALMGPFEGHDGKVMDARQKFGLIKSQMRVIPKDGQAISFHSDEAGTKTNLEELGLQKNGKTNQKVMKAFGDYTRERFPVFSRKDVQAHLHKLFPDLVKDPNKDDEDKKEDEDKKGDDKKDQK